MLTNTEMGALGPENSTTKKGVIATEILDVQKDGVLLSLVLLSQLYPINQIQDQPHHLARQAHPTVECNPPSPVRR